MVVKQQGWIKQLVSLLLMFLWWKSCCSCKVQEVKDGRLSSRIDTSWIENSVNVYFFSSNNHVQKNCNKTTQILFFPKKSFEIYVNFFFTSSNHPFNKIQPPKQILPCFFVPPSFPYGVILQRPEALGQGRSERWATDGSWLAILIHEFHVNHQPRVVGTPRGLCLGETQGSPLLDGWEEGTRTPKGNVWKTPW